MTAGEDQVQFTRPTDRNPQETLANVPYVENFTGMKTSSSWLLFHLYEEIPLLFSSGLPP
jgi:hypothetical protein